MKQKLVFYSSFFVVAGYLSLSYIAFAFYPGEYSPLHNWLSDLGSQELNPKGAIFYNLGIVLTGLTTLMFFIGLSEWKIAGHKAQNIMLLLTQSFGCLGALAMIMSAIFPININSAHSFWSSWLYILLGTAFGFTAAALRYHLHFPKSLIFLGILVAVVDMIWSLLLNIYIMEWVTIALFLCFILLIGIETKRKSRYSYDVEKRFQQV